MRYEHTPGVGVIPGPHVGIGVGEAVGSAVAVAVGVMVGVGVGGPRLVQILIACPGVLAVPAVISVPAGGSVRVTSPAGRLFASGPWSWHTR